MHIPLFPLHTVVLPEGQLPLRLFEPRYLDMLKRCLRDDSCFGVCLIREGQEAGGAAKPYGAGTTVRVADWSQGSDGLLHVVAIGESKFTLAETYVAADGLMFGEVTLLSDEPEIPMPQEYSTLSTLLERLLQQYPWNRDLSDHKLGEARWVGSRLLEILPIEKQLRHQLFLCDDPLVRIEKLADYLEKFSTTVN